MEYVNTMENEGKEEEEHADFIFKVVIVGNSGVGKSNMLTKFIFDEFTLSSKATIGAELFSKTFIIEEKVIILQIWDTAGQERYKSLTKSYFKGAKGAMIVYDITDTNSFESVNEWNQTIKDCGESDVSVMLIGNKSDLEHNRKVKTQSGINKSKDLSKYITQILK